MRLRPQTIHGEFALFALSLVLPLVALIGYGSYDRARSEFATAGEVARRIAESNADRTAEYVASLRSSLEAVARRPQVRAMDATRCDPRLADLVDLYPRVSSFIVVDREGVILCSSRPLPRDRVERIADDELLREMLAAPGFRVSKPVRSRVTGRWIVSAVQPVLGEGGAFLGTVAVATDLLQWRPFPPADALPAGATVTLVTADGTIIVRSVDADKWVGRKMQDERVIKQVVERKEGVVLAKGADDVDRVFGVSAVADLPWFVLAGLPEEGVFAPARKRLRETAAFLALVVGAVLALAWGFAARFTRPITAIAEAVRARAEGLGDTRIPVGGPTEVTDVARELNRMIESGERDARELAKQAKRLRILHDIDRAIISAVKPDAIAAAMIEPLRELLDVPRAIVNLIDLPAGEVEWLAAAGRHRVRLGPGVRYSIRLMGDMGGLLRGEPQRIDVHALPPGPEVEALLASGVHAYMAVPMIAGGELIGALSFGGEQASFPDEQIAIAQEVATQLAIAMAHARLFERVQRQAEELELRVRERTAELEAANKELEAFSYSVSHDLRSPLRAIDGYSLMLEQDHGSRLDGEGLRLLAVVRQSTAQMGRLIDDLLKFSQIGRRPLVLAPLDMRSLAGEVIAESARANPKAQIELGTLPEALGDRALLRQVWANLIGNALKYSARRGAQRVQIGGRAEGAENIYWVRDNGAGFDMRYYNKLFKVFQRLHGEDEFEGTGVGLAIVERVIARHGGRVWGEGALGAGACFSFALPHEG